MTRKIALILTFLSSWGSSAAFGFPQAPSEERASADKAHLVLRKSQIATIFNTLDGTSEGAVKEQIEATIGVTGVNEKGREVFNNSVWSYEYYFRDVKFYDKNDPFTLSYIEYYGVESNKYLGFSVASQIRNVADEPPDCLSLGDVVNFANANGWSVDRFYVLWTEHGFKAHKGKLHPKADAIGGVGERQISDKEYASIEKTLSTQGCVTSISISTKLSQAY